MAGNAPALKAVLSLYLNNLVHSLVNDNEAFAQMMGDGNARRAITNSALKVAIGTPPSTRL